MTWSEFGLEAIISHRWTVLGLVSVAVDMFALTTNSIRIHIYIWNKHERGIVREKDTDMTLM